MNNFDFILNKNNPINIWRTTKLQEAPYQSEMATFHHEVNLTEGYVQIEYPIRKQFLQERLNKEIPFPSDSQAMDAVSSNAGNEGATKQFAPFSQVYFPFENPRLEFSFFSPVPHQLSIYGQTFLNITQSGSYPFIVRTCGSTIIWVNGEKQVEYMPYTRNLASSQAFDLVFKTGINEIIIYMDDLAERDVNFFTELCYQGETSIAGFVPMEENPEKVRQTIALLDSIWIETDELRCGDLEIFFDEEQAATAELMMVMVGERLITADFRNRQGNTLLIAPLSDLPSFGFQKVNFTINIGTLNITRKIVVSIYQEGERQVASHLAQRKSEALDFYIDTYEKERKYDINIGIARTHKKGFVDEETKAHIRCCYDEIISKSDCADFRFAPLLAYAIKYCNEIPADLKSEIQDLALDFRYWIDEPGNDVMWWFSENHALLFHICQYLAGHLYPKEHFNVSGRMGQEQYQIGKMRLEEWFEIFFKYGFSEWNSTTYLPIDLIGFFALYESAPDKSIRDLAKQALDFTYEIIAKNFFDKTMSATYGRVYEHDLKALKSGELANLTYVSWGHGYLNGSLRCIVPFCVSNYEQPKHLQVLLDAKKPLYFRYVQGIQKVQSVQFRTSDYSISCAENFRPFEKGHQQHIMNVSLGGDCTHIWINHPGEAVYSGENRPSFWAGNGLLPKVWQDENKMTMEYRLTEPYLPYIHAYIPYWKLDEIVETAHWFFARKNNGYIGIYFSAGAKRITTGANAYRELRAEGLWHRVFVVCHSATEFADFTTFIAQYQECSWEELKATVRIEGSDL